MSQLFFSILVLVCCLKVCVCVWAGVFWRQLCLRARDGRIVVAEGGWEEIMEKAILPAEGVWHLLCSQRQSQGEHLYNGRTTSRI